MIKIIVDKTVVDKLHEVRQIIQHDDIEFSMPSTHIQNIQEGNIKKKNGFLSSEVLNLDGVQALLTKASELKYPLPDEVTVLALLSNNEGDSDDYLALVGLKSNSEIKKELSAYDIRKKWGRVILAGFGPGDHWLITKKAEYNLHRAEVIFYDDLVNQQYLDRYCASKIYVGKRKGLHKFDQEKINELMYQEALKGKWVVRIKGGDPLIFGRGAEEYHYLKSRFVESEIIPGITSAFAAAANAIIPLTERSLSSSVVFLSGHDLDKLRIPKADTLVFYMGASHQQALAQRIINEGWHPNTPVGIVHEASKPEQKIYRGTLQKLVEKDSGLPSPSIIIVGKTAQVYNPNPNKWMYTGVSVNDWEMDENIVHTPLVSINSVNLDKDSINILENIATYDRIIFTSRYSVLYFYELLFKIGLDARALYHLNIDSVGHVTSSVLKEKGLLVDPLTKDETSESMLKYYRSQDIVTERILIPGSGQGSNRLRAGLEKLGNKVTSLKVYEMNKNEAVVKQNLDLFEGVIFTSPKTVEVFKEVYGCLPDHLKITTRGSQTKLKVEEYKKNCKKILS